MRLSLLQRIVVCALRFLGKHTSKKLSESAHEHRLHNEQIEKDLHNHLYKGRYITDQRKLSDMKLGKSDMGYAGCELISLYNALECFEKHSSLSSLIFEAESSGALVRNGKWGINPYLLDKLASQHGLSCNNITKNTPPINEPGVYIISFWNSRKLTSGIHTVCVNAASDEIIAYNYRYADRPYTVSCENGFEALFKGKPVFLVYSIN